MKILFISIFCLEKRIAENSMIYLIINDEIVFPFVYFIGEVEIYTNDKLKVNKSH